MRIKVFFFVFVFFIFTFISAFLIAATTDEEQELTNLSEDLESARQQSLDQDLDELEKMLNTDEQTHRKDLEELSKQEDPFIQDKTNDEALEPQQVVESPVATPLVVTPLVAVPPEDEAADDTDTDETATVLVPADDDTAPEDDTYDVAEEAEAPPKDATFSEKELKAAEINRAIVLFKPTPIRKSPQHFGLSISGGPFKPNKFIGQGDPFRKVYTGEGWFLDNAGLWVDVALEWQFYQKAGRLALKGTSGLWYIQGDHDATSDSSSNKLKYQLFVFPAFIGGVYRMQYFTNQFIIPYVEASYGGFQFQQRQGAKDDHYSLFRRAYILGGGGCNSTPTSSIVRVQKNLIMNGV